MGTEVVIIGAVAIGPKVACRIKRIAPDTKVTLIDQDSHISYGGCGIPYYIGGDVPELDALYSTSAHVPRDSSYFENVKGVNVKIRTEALSIDKKNKTVKIRDLHNKKEENIKIPDNLNYDNVQNIAIEARSKLNAIRPLTISQASRISGVNPTDIQMLILHIKRGYET